MSEIKIPITPNNLPKGTHWDEDLAAWEAIRTRAGIDDSRDWWRWAPVNLKAFEKGVPDKPLVDFYPVFPHFPPTTET